MALLDEILTWANQDLKPWQSDAVRRLFQKTELDTSDFQELSQMLKASKKLKLVSGGAPAVPIPLTASHLPAIHRQTHTAVLTELHSLKSVNRLAKDQRLSFLPRGLTVIYGDNGAGKSGYSRVLKSACRARVKDEPVLPDARESDLFHDTPQATFVVSIEGRPIEIPWSANADAPEELSSVAVLDTHCARAYTDKEGELIFTPWGFDIFESLARVVYPAVEALIKTEQSALPTSDIAFSDLKAGATETARFLTSLSHTTTDSAVDKACTFTEQDQQRLEALESALQEKSPKSRAQRLREQSHRLDALVQTLSGAAAAASDTEIDRLKEIDNDLSDYEEAERLAATALRGNSHLLDGTGEGPWRTMFLAAQAFVKGDAYSLDTGSPCPLCQTPLDEQASDRMTRFASFVIEDASERAATQKRVHQSAFKRVQAIIDTPLVLDETTLEFVANRSQGWGASLLRFMHQRSTRLERSTQAGTDTHDWSNFPPLDTKFLNTPMWFAEGLRERANALDAVDKPMEREQFKLETEELKARQALSLRKDALLGVLNAKREHHALAACLTDLKPRPVSDKARSLAETVITAQLSKALNEEFENLGVSHLKTSVDTRNEKGRHYVQLVLDLPGFQAPKRVLSEGEQRIIAIGSFFAELKVSGHQGAAVFDDPVSSLDQFRRGHVARRLVEEASCRQVIVFTHDTVFLAELKVALERASTPHLFQHLTYSQQSAGFVNDGLPWHHQGSKDRIDKLEKLANKLKIDEQTLDITLLEEEVRRIYGRLREVVERAVEEVILGGVLERYNDYVRVPKIADTVGLTAEECKPIIDLYTRVSDWLAGHDKASARGFSVPTANQIKGDIELLRTSLDAIRNRRKANKPRAPAVI